MVCVFVSLPLGAMGWSVVVAFPGHIHLFFTIFIIIKFDLVFGYILYCVHI